ncbi:unnamed protein product [Protopolystoma xenopodis]|uniref:Uncharacterized protein n=1 Tax=Protopolystoma xenopodis TaxID=117903 RepID=A0A448WC96_9PLAT|nr:unnamed protein product [Protopolystoma xenopodis]
MCFLSDGLSIFARAESQNCIAPLASIAPNSGAPSCRRSPAATLSSATSQPRSDSFVCESLDKPKSLQQTENMPLLPLVQHTVAHRF